MPPEEQKASQPPAEVERARTVGDSIEAGDEPEASESLEDVKHRDVRDLNEIPPEDQEALVGQALKDQVELKRDYARFFLWLVAAELVVVNGIFLAIAWFGYDWKAPASVLHVWLVATFVQVISVFAIIVRGLFSGDDVKAAAGVATHKQLGRASDRPRRALPPRRSQRDR
jgi:hypothetical protein